jgi:hypothetical protein
MRERVRSEGSNMADLLWNWSYKNSDLTPPCKGSGTFTTTEQQGSDGSQYYIITGIMGTVEGNTITSLLPPDSLGYENDNKLAPSGLPWLNANHKVTGIAFLTNNDSPTHANVNLLYSYFIDNIAGFYIQILGPNNLALENIVFSAKQSGVIGC